MDSGGKTALLVVITVIVLVISLVVEGSGGCDVPPDRVNSTLRAYGFTDAVITGHAWLECGDDYTLSSNFTAKNANGEPVSGVICCGYMKSCTLKF